MSIPRIPSEIKRIVELAPEEWKQFLTEQYGIRDAFLMEAKIVDHDRQTHPDVIQKRIDESQKLINIHTKLIENLKRNLDSSLGEEHKQHFLEKARQKEKQIKYFRLIRDNKDTLSQAMKDINEKMDADLSRTTKPSDL